MSSDEITHTVIGPLAEEVAHSAAALAETFSRDTPNPAICVADGWGLRVRVNRGHLEIADGVGRHRRVRRYAKATHGLSRVVVIGAAGMLSLEALRWCAGTGIAIVVLDPSDGSVLTTSGSGAVDDGRIRRAQALALGTPTGMAIARYLISVKLAGQADVASVDLGNPAVAATITRLAGNLEETATLEEVRQLEAATANLYWKAWESMRPSFVTRDDPKIPQHWRLFEGRRSAVNPGTARSATDPANALLNYSYRLVEAEGRLATLSLGLDPGLGILHADMRNRDGFVLDLIESCRPLADRYVARLLAGHTFRRGDFAEDARGVVRVMSPLSHRLAEAMPSFGTGMAPVAEHVAKLLAEASPYSLTSPSVLTRAKHKEAARYRAGEAGIRGNAAGMRQDRAAIKGAIGPQAPGLSNRKKTRQRPKPSASPQLPLQVCRGCGAKLTIETNRAKPRSEWCPGCLPDRRQEVGTSLPSAARAASDRFLRETGTLPTQAPEARRARSMANARQRKEELAFEESSAGETGLNAAWFESVIRSRLSTFTLPTIAKRAGVSTSAAAKWRAGRRIPHPRHWTVLAELVGVTQPSARNDERGR
jgi:CRISPR-associated endonuclease Cas1